MSQTWTDNPFASGNVGQTDLQNMENNFLALKSMFSGASAPSNAVAAMPWFDTGQKVLKSRNNDNDAWLGLFHGDVSEKRLVYRDAALEGYARDSGVTDKVIALKGGTIYTTGAATAGSFSILTANIQAHDHDGSIAIRDAENAVLRATVVDAGVRSAGIVSPFSVNASWGKTGTSGGADGLYRPAAAVCILIYLDL